jgi:hypothetical protein
MHSLPAATESYLLQKVKSVVPKITSGMHKVRVHLQALSGSCQKVRPGPEVKSVILKLTSGMHKVGVQLFICKHSLTDAKKSDPLQKVKSVVPKVTRGMHKVRDHLQALSDRFQRVRPAPEGEECRPQAHQWYAQGKGSSVSTP